MSLLKPDQKQTPPSHINVRYRLLGGRRVLGHCLGSLRYGVLGQLAGQNKPHGCLDFARRDGGLLVVCSKLGSLSGYALEDVVDEGVQDGHGTVGDTGVWVNLLEDWKTKRVSELGRGWNAHQMRRANEVRSHTLVDVRAVSLLAGLGALLLLASWGGGLLAGLLLLSRSLASWCLAGGGWGLQNASVSGVARKCGKRRLTDLGCCLWCHFDGLMWFLKLFESGG